MKSVLVLSVKFWFCSFAKG